jgi:hypothetical protein
MSERERERERGREGTIPTSETQGERRGADTENWEGRIQRSEQSMNAEHEEIEQGM